MKITQEIMERAEKLQEEISREMKLMNPNGEVNYDDLRFVLLLCKIVELENEIEFIKK